MACFGQRIGLICLVVLTVALTVVGCGKKGGGDSDENAVGPATGSSLVGAWHTTCMNDKDGSARGFADVDGNTMVTSSRNFGLTDCRNGDHFDDYRSTYSILSFVDPSEMAGWSTLKVTVSSHRLTYLSQAAADWANSAAWFGYTDWQPNVGKDIAGRKSKADDPARTPRSRVGETRYFTMTVEDGKLRFANYKNGQALRSEDVWDVMERR